ncbi:MAG: MBL fold metallo-hydrolase [Candidatus Korobacteraceae bacterium]|jgi:ribonuclease Z
MSITRRDALKASGLAVGGLALGGALNRGFAPTAAACINGKCQESAEGGNQNSFFDALETCCPLSESVAPDEMRITFLGTSCVPRLAQECNSVFVELGSGDTFVFDCGSGVVAKYAAMKIPYSQMAKIFLTHLHGDHMSDLTHIYCFGPSIDRKSPLYVWGPSPSGVPDPVTHQLYNDGTKAFCAGFRELMRWHSESFSFLPTAYKSFVPPDWDPTQSRDGYDIVPFELDWRTPGIAYPPNGNNDSDVLITHFPAVHDRQGAISYKLEWKSQGLSMIFSGDTKPNYYMIDQATQGVDVLIHELVVPPEVWAEKNADICPPPAFGVYLAQEIQDSSHTPEKAFGYILSQLKVPPRLAVATHFQATDDTINPALKDIRLWYPKGEVTFACDLMVLNVTKAGIRQRRGDVSSYA